jgi:hypothetical protein
VDLPLPPDPLQAFDELWHFLRLMEMLKSFCTNGPSTMQDGATMTH